jgi:hypothetical protein
MNNMATCSKDKMGHFGGCHFWNLMEISFLRIPSQFPKDKTISEDQNFLRNNSLTVSS